MSNIDTTVLFFKAIQSGDWQSVRELTTTDFMYYGSLPDPVNRDFWLDFQEAVIAAFPDWDYELLKVEEIDKDHVKVVTNITATHTIDLVLPLHSVQPLPATNTKISLPKESATLGFRKGKIFEMRIDYSPHGGIEGIFEQLRAE